MTHALKGGFLPDEEHPCKLTKKEVRALGNNLTGNVEYLFKERTRCAQIPIDLITIFNQVR